MSALVLIVDDNERNAKLARDVLEHAGLRTLVAGTAQEALELAREQRPDLVLMDLNLPDLPGVEATRRLAADERTSSIPVVAVTATALDGAAWIREAGFAGLIAKPIDVLELPGQVRRYCGG